MQHWCGWCGELRVFAPVPDTGPADFACVECGAAVSVEAPAADHRYAAVA